MRLIERSASRLAHNAYMSPDGDDLCCDNAEEKTTGWGYMEQSLMS